MSFLNIELDPEKMKEAFKTYDINGDGFITKEGEINLFLSQIKKNLYFSYLQSLSYIKPKFSSLTYPKIKNRIQDHPCKIRRKLGG